MIIKEFDINYNKILGIGSEGIVYFYNDDALKIFNNPTKNKEEKVKILKNLHLKNFILPKELVYNEKGDFKGYLMDKVDVSFERTIDFKIRSLETLSEKIEFLKMQENLLKLAHKNDIFLVDLNYLNFLVDRNNDLYAIDTDNYYIGKYSNDIKPTNYYHYYIDKVSNKITKDIDIMSYTLNLLYLLTDRGFSRDKMIYYNGDDYIEKFINDLVLPKIIKNLIIEIVSDSVNKPYLEDNLDLLKSEQRYLVRRNK